MSVDPKLAKLVTDDIVRFWRAYDKAAPTFSGETFNQFYLRPGSPGIEGFLAERIRNAEHLAFTIRTRPLFYRTIRPETLRVPEMEPKIRAAFTDFAALYPQAVFPDVYFVIGAMNSGGTASATTLIVGTEMFSLSDQVAQVELGSWEKSVIKPICELPYIVMHELIHFQQSHKPKNLLDYALIEGSADLITKLVMGKTINENVHAYAQRHERTLWREFEQVMRGERLQDWLYNGENSVDRPADLGYWIGYKIAEMYCAKAVNERQAIFDIINLQDAEVFLAASGYAGTFG